MHQKVPVGCAEVPSVPAGGAEVSVVPAVPVGSTKVSVGSTKVPVVPLECTEVSVGGAKKGWIGVLVLTTGGGTTRSSGLKLSTS